MRCLGSWFQRFKFRVNWLHRFEPEVRQNIRVEGPDGEKLFSSWPPGKEKEKEGGKQGEKREKKKGTERQGKEEMAGDKIYPSGHGPSDLLLPARLHYLQFPPPPNCGIKYEFLIDKNTDEVGTSPSSHFPKAHLWTLLHEGTSLQHMSLGGPGGTVQMQTIAQRKFLFFICSF